LLGFTRKEQGLLLFLSVTFLAGTLTWLYRDRWIPLPALDKNVEINRVFSGDSLQPAERNAEQQPVSINRASKEMLQTLPGIGPVMAQRIIDFRNQHQRFQTVNDLLKVKGIGTKTLEKLRNHIKL
jgi:comEA protein